MKKYCPYCFRQITVNKKGKVYRYGFRKNRWIFDDSNSKTEYKRVDGEPCRGSWRIGLTRDQLIKKK